MTLDIGRAGKPARYVPFRDGGTKKVASTSITVMTCLPWMGEFIKTVMGQVKVQPEPCVFSIQFVIRYTQVIAPVLYMNDLSPWKQEIVMATCTIKQVLVEVKINGNA